jgi:glycosyltransferase involved in cell wall biosynthesis
MQTAALLKDRRVRFALVGSGSQKERIQKLAESLGLNNVAFMQPVPRASVPALLDAIDVLYIGLKQQPMFRYGVSPHKLLDYMMAGKPVIHAIDAPNDMVREAGCGVSTPPGDPAALGKAIEMLAECGPDELARIGARGRDYVVKNHDYRILARRFLEDI